MGPQQSRTFFDTAVHVTQPTKHPINGLPVTDPHERVECSNCGKMVYARPMAVSAGHVEYFLPVDERGWCGVCLWMEGAR